jgi:hypothetical protein
MGIVEIITLISGILKFLPEIRKLVLVLEKSPAQRATEISTLLSEESEKLRTTGRPTWGE